MGLEWQEVQFFLLETEDLCSSAARGTNLRNSSCVSLKSGQVLVFWKVSLGLWSSFWHLSQRRSGRSPQKQTQCWSLKIIWQAKSSFHSNYGQQKQKEECVTCESGYGSSGWGVRCGQETFILLMGEKDLIIIVLLFAGATDVDIWAHLHHHRMTCSHFGWQRTQNRK